MSAFNTFLLGFCTVCVLIGALYMLCPSGVLEKSVKYVFCLVFLCTIISGISGVFNIDFDISDYSVDYTDNTDIYTKATQINLETALKIANINFSKVIVYTDKNDTGSIEINKVIVYSDAAPEEIIETIGNGDLYEVEIINE